VLAQPEVQQTDVAFGVEDDVVGLDVSVDVVQVAVDVVDCLHQLRNVEAALVLVERVLPHEVGHQVAARQVIHHHVQEIVILERVVEADDPVVLRLAQRVLLGAHVVHLVFVDHLLLAHLLQREDLARVPFAAESHDAEGAGADDLDELEVADHDLLAALAHVLVLLPVEVLLHHLLHVLRRVLELLRELLRLGLPLLEVHHPLGLLVLDGLLEGLQPGIPRRRRRGRGGRRLGAGGRHGGLHRPPGLRVLRPGPRRRRTTSERTNQLVGRPTGQRTNQLGVPVGWPARALRRAIQA